MPVNHRAPLLCLAFALCIVAAASPGAKAARINYNVNDMGNPLEPPQTASVPEPGTIMVFIPAGLTGADRMAFEMGAGIWFECLIKVKVQFKDGPPPEGAMNFIDVQIVDELPGDLLGNTLSSALLPPDGSNGTIEMSVIQIESGTLGNANLLKNIGAHELGHALGIDHDATKGPTGERINVMDPGFTPSSPFVGLSASDKMMLDDAYMIVPAPLAVTGGTALLIPLAAHRPRPKKQIGSWPTDFQR